jgi:hypothetical protein
MKIYTEVLIDTFHTTSDMMLTASITIALGAGILCWKLCQGKIKDLS